MTDTDRVLASIDETLDGYVTWHGYSDDAMSWKAAPAEPFNEAAWLEDGEITGEFDNDESPGDVQIMRINVDVSRGSATLSSQPPRDQTRGLDPEAAVRALAAFSDALRPQFEALKSAMISVGKAFQQMVDANHSSFAAMTYGDEYPKHYARCRLCNPAGNPKALRVNGVEYRRRTRSRKRRNRR